MGIADEEAELVREMIEFLERGVPEVLIHAHHQLENAERRWIRMEAQEEETGKSMKAKVKVEGHLIADAEIEVNLRRGYLVNVKLQQRCVLDQLLEFHRILQSQYRHMEHITQALRTQLPALPSDDHGAGDGNLPAVGTLVHHVVEELSNLCQELRKGGYAVRLPSKRRFPYCTQLDHAFQPPLPSDMLVDFSVHQARLLIDAFVLTPSTKPVDDVLSAASKKEFVGQVTIFRGQTVEVVKQTSVTMDLPGLDDMLTSLDTVVARLLHVRDQGDALLQCYTMPPTTSFCRLSVDA
ncbi:Aste57867_19420 [Aphanomyces stellatus]|uniref:Aste57867_19420 protein n=1 Tax=Aphanomyces stellatus TaxID=120398 RepID=A0A485LD49_9STRA|nr:hypothetical protein As57867_019356 [Aphanomyces stellatus]VFT96134.1 Aste57867_19420 [Aphanomyces stellatus]